MSLMKKICSKCGAVNSEKTIWCINCGEGLKDAEIVYENEKNNDYETQHNQRIRKENRPFLINLFLTVYVFKLFYFLYSSAILISIGTIGSIQGDRSLVIFLILTFLLIALSILNIILIYGILKRKTWSWKIATSILFISMILGLLNKDYVIIFGVIIDVLFLISYSSKNIRSFFIY